MKSETNPATDARGRKWAGQRSKRRPRQLSDVSTYDVGCFSFENAFLQELVTVSIRVYPFRSGQIFYFGFSQFRFSDQTSEFSNKIIKTRLIGCPKFGIQFPWSTRIGAAAPAGSRSFYLDANRWRELSREVAGVSLSESQKNFT
jgi:hypothetical protein